MRPEMKPETGPRTGKTPFLFGMTWLKCFDLLVRHNNEAKRSKPTDVAGVTRCNMATLKRGRHPGAKEGAHEERPLARFRRARC
ncbi:hypothetical protein SAMN04488527_102112 [Aliiroseovarius crassostreae]|nr:hypothetical protein SAMN04488527_102112 [Aliiroseovarius crassostreae]